MNFDDKKWRKNSICYELKTEQYFVVVKWVYHVGDLIYWEKTILLVEMFARDLCMIWREAFWLVVQSVFHDVICVHHATSSNFTIRYQLKLCHWEEKQCLHLHSKFPPPPHFHCLYLWLFSYLFMRSLRASTSPEIPTKFSRVHLLYQMLTGL